MLGVQSDRVRLNIGGRRYETTMRTLTGDGEMPTFFTSLLRHALPATDDAPEIFIDRDGDAFAPLLSFLRTGVLHIAPTQSEAMVRQEADYYCIPLPPPEPVRPPGPVRSDGLYLSFADRRVHDASGSGPGFDAGTGAGTGTGTSSVVTGDVRAYLQFGRNKVVVLGRREADGQWSAMRCRYACVEGGLLTVYRKLARDLGSDHEPEAASSDTGSEQEQTQDPIELSAVVLDGDFIEVITCGRVGRLEKPFHFVRSCPPLPGTAFVSQTAHNALTGMAPGRVVLSFASASSVGVMVTSSHPGWSAAAESQFRAFCGDRAKAGAGGNGAGETSAQAEEGEAAASGTSPLAPSEVLWHIDIRNVNFTRTVAFVSLGEHALVEFVQLNAQHEPQPIWYRPIAKTSNPWKLPSR